ncbi:MAG: fibrobacter succinogenes major paralogous domain-containing protein [Patescibacteria group bacterium]
MNLKSKSSRQNRPEAWKKQDKKPKINSKKPLLATLILAVAITGGVAVYQSFTTESATFGWIQTDWSGGNTENTATHETDQTGWTEFANKDANLDTSTPGEISAEGTVETTTRTTNEDFEESTIDELAIENDEIRGWLCGDSIQDTEGNTYSTVEINDQCWMAENMRTTTYPDGTSITKGPSAHGASGWDTDQGYYSCPPNSSSDGEDCAAADSLGMLYQWSAAMAGSTNEGVQGICPDGWRVPTDDEWHALEDYLTADGNTCDSTRDGDWDCDPAGSKLAGNDAEDEDWNSGTLTNHSDFDSSGFNASPSGYRVTNGGYDDRSSDANFWSSSESGGYAWRRYLYDGNSKVNRSDPDKAYGFSVRCLKD